MKTQTSNQKCYIFVLLCFLLTFGMKGSVYAQNLDVGEPRTVRMIYFLPNDSPYQADVIQQMKDEILVVQTFYAEQMQAYGYGKKTFRFETDAKGEPKVRRVDGQHPFSHYDNTLGSAVIKELEQVFDLDANVYVIVLGADVIRDSNGQRRGGMGFRRGKNGGNAVVEREFRWGTAAHELGHAFGLVHDFRDDTYLMAYGPNRQLSACAAEFLAVHPYFNADIPIEEEMPPKIELMSSPTYPVGSKSVTIRLKLSDSEGLHQIFLHDYGVAMCRGLEGEKDVVVEFDYSGSFNYDGFKGFSENVWQPVTVDVVDTDGNVSRLFFRLTEKQEHHIDTLGVDTGERNPVKLLVFSPDSTVLASGSEDGMFKLWDVARRQQIDSFEFETRVGDYEYEGGARYALSPLSKILAYKHISFAPIQLWDVERRQEIGTLEPIESGAWSMAFSPDDTILATGLWDGRVRLWDVARQQEIDTLEGHTERVGVVAFSPDGTILASGSYDGTIRLWDVARRQQIDTIDSHTEAIYSMAFSPNGMILAAATDDETIQLWDVVTRQQIDTFGRHVFVNSVAFSPDGTILVSGGGAGTIKLWDVERGVNFISLPSSTTAVLSVAFSPDGTTLAAGTYKGTFDLWDVEGLLSQQPIDDRDQITISEIMVASNDGSLPQWIELYNSSGTHTVNLQGWKLEIQNHHSANFAGRRNVTLTFKEKSIKPQETLLIVSRQGRSLSIQDNQIYNLSSLHPNLQDIVLSEEGFYLKLSNAADELIDEVGNLDGKRNTNDTPSWQLPQNLTEEGTRASMIRRHNDEGPLPGTEKDSWITAINTQLATGPITGGVTLFVYYGHPDDIGAPGIKSGGALPVTLSHFRANRTDTGVVVKWITESELDNAGFNILRSETKNGEFKVINLKGIISGHGTTNERHTYTWTDATAKPNVAYYYQIEDISHAGVRKQLATVRMRGLVSASGKLTTKWGDLKLQQ